MVTGGSCGGAGGCCDGGIDVDGGGDGGYGCTNACSDRCNAGGMDGICKKIKIK